MREGKGPRYDAQHSPDPAQRAAHLESEKVEAVAQVRAYKQGGFSAVGDPHTLLHDPVGGQGRDFLEQPLVVDIGDIHAESAFLGQLHNALVGMTEVSGNFCFNLRRFCLNLHRFCLNLLRFCLNLLRFCLNLHRFCLDSA